MHQGAGITCEEKLTAAVEGLIYVLSSRDGLLRQSVRRSLIAIGEPAVGLLIQALGSKERNVRWEAAKALEEIGDPAAARALVERLRHDKFGIRWIAAEALIKFGKQGLDPLLSELLRDPNTGFLKDGAHHVLYTLSQKDTSLHDILMPIVSALGTVNTADMTPRIQKALDSIRSSAEESS
jgi:HEAT repeat protein